MLIRLALSTRPFPAPTVIVFIALLYFFINHFLFGVQVLVFRIQDSLIVFYRALSFIIPVMVQMVRPIRKVNFE